MPNLPSLVILAVCLVVIVAGLLDKIPKRWYLN